GRQLVEPCSKLRRGSSSRLLAGRRTTPTRRSRCLCHSHSAAARRSGTPFFQQTGPEALSLPCVCRSHRPRHLGVGLLNCPFRRPGTFRRKPEITHTLYFSGSRTKKMPAGSGSRGPLQVRGETGGVDLQLLLPDLAEDHGI